MSRSGQGKIDSGGLLRVVLIIVVASLSLSSVQNGAQATERSHAGSGDVSASQGLSDSNSDGIADAPERTSAVAGAASTGQPVEDLSQRSATGTVVANPDGSFTRTEANDAVRMLVDHEWVDIDYNLVKKPDGSWAPRAAPADVSIGGGPNEAGKVTFKDGQSLAVTLPKDLPEPTIDGGVATYRLSAATDLLIGVTDDGMNAHFQLNKRPMVDDPVFALGLEAEGLDIEKTGSGLTAVDDTGDPVGKTSKLIAWDAQTDAAGDPTNVVPLKSDLDEGVTTGDVTNHSLSLTTPEDFLDDPDTKYPVTIDPNIGGLGLDRDTWIRSGTAAQGSDYRLIIGKINGDGNTNPARSYLQFDTSEMASKNVTNAQLQLWQYYAYTCSDKQMAVHAVDGSWDAGLTWDTKPNANNNIPGVYSSKNRGATGGTGECARGWTSTDITNMTRGWVASQGSNHGLRVMASTETQSSFERRFCSGNPDASQTVCNDAAYKPRLQVTYDDIIDSVDLNSAQDVYDSQADEGSKPLAPQTGRAIQVNGLVGIPMTGTQSVKVRITAKNAAGTGSLQVTPSDTNASTSQTLSFTTGSSATSPVWAFPSEAASIYVRNTSSANVDLKVEVLGYNRIRGADPVGAEFETVTTFEDGSSVIVPQGGGAPTVVSASGAEIAGDRTAPVAVEGANDVETPDTTAQAPDSDVAPVVESDPVSEPAATSPVGVEVLSSRPLTTTTVSGASDVPKGYKYRGGRRSNNYNYLSGWQNVLLRYVDSKTRRVLKRVGSVQVRMRERLHGGDSRMWAIGTDLKYGYGPAYNSRFEVWCGIDRNLATDKTCDEYDTAAKRFYGPIWVVNESIGDDSYSVNVRFGSASGALDKKRYPMLRNRISWDGYSLKGITLFRGYNIRYKSIPEMEAGGEYQLANGYRG